MAAHFRAAEAAITATAPMGLVGAVAVGAFVLAVARRLHRISQPGPALAVAAGGCLAACYLAALQIVYVALASEIAAEDAGTTKGLFVLTIAATPVFGLADRDDPRRGRLRRPTGPAPPHLVVGDHERRRSHRRRERALVRRRRVLLPGRPTTGRRQHPAVLGPPHRRSPGSHKLSQTHQQRKAHADDTRHAADAVIRDLAPDIVRQRLLIEATFTVATDETHVDDFLHGLAAHLDLRTYAQSTIVAPGGLGKADNEGYDAFLPLIDSGISLYVWTRRRFLACVLFTCKAFDDELAIAYVRDTWATDDITSLAF